MVELSPEEKEKVYEEEKERLKARRDAKNEQKAITLQKLKKKYMPIIILGVFLCLGGFIWRLKLIEHIYIEEYGRFYLMPRQRRAEAIILVGAGAIAFGVIMRRGAKKAKPSV